MVDSPQVRRAELATRLGALTEREWQIACRVAQGQRNPEIAEELGIALRTVKRHRQQAMAKLAVATLADLVRVVDERESLPKRGSEGILAPALSKVQSPASRGQDGTRQPSASASNRNPEATPAPINRASQASTPAKFNPMNAQQPANAHRA